MFKNTILCAAILIKIAMIRLRNWENSRKCFTQGCFSMTSHVFCVALYSFESVGQRRHNPRREASHLSNTVPQRRLLGMVMRVVVAVAGLVSHFDVTRLWSGGIFYCNHVYLQLFCWYHAHYQLFQGRVKSCSLISLYDPGVPSQLNETYFIYSAFHPSRISQLLYSYFVSIINDVSSLGLPTCIQYCAWWLLLLLLNTSEKCRQIPLSGDMRRCTRDASANPRRTSWGTPLSSRPRSLKEKKNVWKSK